MDNCEVKESLAKKRIIELSSKYKKESSCGGRGGAGSNDEEDPSRGGTIMDKHFEISSHLIVRFLSDRI